MPVDGRGGERVRFWDRLGLAGIEGQCLVEAKIALGRAARGPRSRCFPTTHASARPPSPTTTTTTEATEPRPTGTLVW